MSIQYIMSKTSDFKYTFTIQSVKNNDFFLYFTRNKIMLGNVAVMWIFSSTVCPFIVKLLYLKH